MGENVVIESIKKEKRVVNGTIIAVLILFSISFLYDLILHINTKDIYLSKQKELISNLYKLNIQHINTLSTRLQNQIKDKGFEQLIKSKNNQEIKKVLDVLLYDLKNENNHIKNIMLYENDTLIVDTCTDANITHTPPIEKNYFDICNGEVVYKISQQIIYDNMYYGKIVLGVSINAITDIIEKFDKDILSFIVLNNKFVSNDIATTKIDENFSFLNSKNSNLIYQACDLKNKLFLKNGKEYVIYDNFVLFKSDDNVSCKVVFMINVSGVNKEFLNKSVERIVMFVIIGTLIMVVFSYGFKYYRQELEKQYNANIEKEHYIREKLISEVMRRVKEVKQKDRIILEQSKLTILGEMISMLSHQWRQPLALVKTSIDSFMISYMLHGKISDDDMVKIKNDVVPKIEYMTQVISNFSDFFKPDDKKISVSPDNLVNSAIHILEDSLQKNDIVCNIECNTHTNLKLYKNEYVQVIINIISNAIEILAHTTQNEKIINISSHIDNEKYVLTIEDNGGGIDAKILDKIFEPYFSTKCPNERGLGLYMAKMMIQKHLKGVLSAYNSQIGAVFKIELNIDK